MDLFNVRKNHKSQASKALMGLNIPDSMLDRVYAKKLKNLDIMKELGLK